MMSSKLRIAFLVFLGMFRRCSAGSYENALLQHLLQNYDTLERPVFNESETLTVSFGVTLINLLEMNLEDGYVEANVRITLQWNDTSMKWDPSKYDNISSVKIPHHRLWTPEIYLYDRWCILPLFNPKHKTKVAVNKDGRMTFVLPGIFKGSCYNYAMNYPFDDQKCFLRFEGWTTDAATIDFQLSTEAGAELKNYIPHGEWNLIGVTGTRNTIYYTCCDDPRVDILFLIDLRRHGQELFYACIVALLFGVLTMLFSFLLPSACGQRIPLGVVAFLAAYAIEVAIERTLGGRTSSMGLYFFRLANMIFASILSNILIIHLYSRNPTIHSMPDWLQKLVCDIIPPFIWLNRPDKGKSDTISDNHLGQEFRTNEQNQDDICSVIKAVTEPESRRIGWKQIQPCVINDWQYFAIVLDRLIFLSYLVASATFFSAFYFAFK